MKEAVVLAGGFGTRLRSVVSDMPKPMAPVAGRPFLTYVLDRLKLQGYTHVVLSTGYLHEKVEDFFAKDYRGMAIDYARETEPLGTGGAIVNAQQYCKDDELTVLNGDTIFDVDYSELSRFFHQHDTHLVVVLRRVPDAGRYGLVEVNGQGRITAFREKDPFTGPGTINGGIYQIHRRLLDGYQVGDVFSFERDLMQRRFKEEPFYAYSAEGYFIDIGIPEDYARAQKELPVL